MSLQVGSACYATAVDAGRAACAQFQPVTEIQGNLVKSVYCSNSSGLPGQINGELNLVVVTTDTTTNSTTQQLVTQTPVFPDCVLPDYLAAAEVIIGGVLALWCIWYGGMKLISLFNWSRGEQNG